ncbi:PTS glucose transporter subunit IIA [Irregularibacter muris]|uniref:PTS glucose transporter subunit IIA n=1 Tax=Irregularibacter muris TaxID=1796619 RepID=A0AAE3HD52_9FIRM|nr:PTS glucose transporter subunit IIA [Irregularibacter muris]MCR1898255.1 PTS glucose transporter subunit IIA [Irregularibacter muris]
MFGILKKSNKKLEIKAPIKGKLIKIEDVDDPVFAQKMVGDGVAIDPKENKVLSPIDGEVIEVFPTKHALGLKTENNVEILIHIGLDTVDLKGEGFEVHVKAQDKVKIGDPLVTFDREILKEKAKSLIIPVLITNYQEMKAIEIKEGEINPIEDTIMTVKTK